MHHFVKKEKIGDERKGKKHKKQNREGMGGKKTKAEKVKRGDGRNKTSRKRKKKVQEKERDHRLKTKKKRKSISCCLESEKPLGWFFWGGCWRAERGKTGGRQVVAAPPPSFCSLLSVLAEPTHLQPYPPPIISSSPPSPPLSSWLIFPLFFLISRISWGLGVSYKRWVSPWFLFPV